MVVRLDVKKRERPAEPPIRFVPRKARAVSVSLPPPSAQPADTLGSSIDRQRAESEAEPVHIKSASESQQQPISEDTFQRSQSETQPPVRKWTQKHRAEMTDRDWRAMRADLQLRTSEPVFPLLEWTELETAGTLGSRLKQRLLRDFPRPTPIQRATAGPARNGCDCIGIAPTGSGKTLAFVLPFLLNSKLQHGLVLAPTRELAAQTSELVQSLCAGEVGCVLLVGGHDLAVQQQQLTQLRAGQRRLVVATPGRLLDVVQRHSGLLSSVTYLVLDEADRMLDLGFEPQLREIAGLLTSATRQTLLFSATWPAAVRTFAAEFLKPNALQIEVVSQMEQIAQEAVYIDAQSSKFGLLQQRLKTAKTAIVFVASKLAVDQLVERLAVGAGVRAVGLHGGMPQESRERALAAFKSRARTVLVATDVAARGVDVPAVSLVVNYDAPNTAETYVHRIGRTGRGDLRGRAVSLLSDSDRDLFPALRRLFTASGCVVPPFMR